MKNSFTRILALAALVALQPVLAQDNHNHDHGHGEYRGARLAVSDAGTNFVHILDIDSSSVVGSFTVPGETGGTLTVTDSGQYAILAHGAANRVSIIHSGLTAENHGDHGHLLQGSPYVVATLNTGQRPTQLVPAGDKVVIFNEGEGSIAILDENLFGLSLNYDLIETDFPDHGAPLLIGDLVLAGYMSTGSVDVYDMDNNLIDSTGDCPGLHGAILVGDTGVFGCTDGVLLAELHGDHFHWNHVANPAGTPEGTRVGTFYGQYGDVAVGNFGAGLAFVDVVNGTMSTLDLPETLFGAAASGDHVAVLTSDGSVHLVHVREGHGHLEATVENVVSGNTDSGRPGITALGDRAFVTDPENSQIIVLHAGHEALEVEGTIAVPGNPSGIRALILDGDFGWH